MSALKQAFAQSQTANQKGDSPDRCAIPIGLRPPNSGRAGQIQAPAGHALAVGLLPRSLSASQTLQYATMSQVGARHSVRARRG